MAKKRKKVKTSRKKEGVATGVLKAIPGVGSLVETLEKSSEAFRERLKEVDTEVERRLGEHPLRKATPKIRASYSIRPIRKEVEPTHPKMITKKKKVKSVKIEEKEPLVDVFDELDKVRVIAELPGIEEKDVRIKLKRNELTISAGKYYKKMKLPHAVKKKISKTFRHGILEVILDKSKRQ